MSDDYQPLAAYGAQSNITIQEARFKPGVSDDALVRAGRIGARFIRPTDGFRSLIYIHDGQRARVLSNWRDEAAIQRYHSTVKPKMMEYEATHWPESPWQTELAGMRTGTATPYLVSPRMTVSHHDIVVWDPPAAVLIHDLSNIRDSAPLLALWTGIAPETGRSPLLDHQGFMFFSACDFGGGDFSVYLGFQSDAQLERFLASPFYAGYERALGEILAAREAERVTARGRLICGCVKHMG